MIIPFTRQRVIDIAARQELIGSKHVDLPPGSALAVM